MRFAHPKMKVVTNCHVFSKGAMVFAWFRVRETGIVIHFLKQVEIKVKHKLLSDIRIHWLWENKQGRRGYLRGP